MKIAIISGSHRKEGQSAKVARYLQHVVTMQCASDTTYLFSLANNPLPLWDEGVWAQAAQWKTLWGPIAQELRSADAVVVVSPEWSGMVPAGLKNFFLFCTPQELGNKPGLIVTVSASRGGAYPVNELRTSSYKNCAFCYIPEHVIVRQVGDMLNDPTTPASPDDEYIRARLGYAVQMLRSYGEALRHVRESGIPDYQTYPYGM
ncbi:MAG: NAD(P)H-dependent oxidoreductase [Deltaproteobacteria bacterium]|nr:NAD(P)H-dependent oxidoreductase [Deltaproteobacteria bacterium]